MEYSGKRKSLRINHVFVLFFRQLVYLPSAASFSGFSFFDCTSVFSNVYLQNIGNDMFVTQLTLIFFQV